MKHLQSERAGTLQYAKGFVVALSCSCHRADKSPLWSSPDGCYVPQKPVRYTGSLSLDCLKKSRTEQKVRKVFFTEYR